MIGIGVIGYGYWGPNLARNFPRRRAAAWSASPISRRQRLRALASAIRRVELLHPDPARR